MSFNFRVLFQATMGRNKKDPATTGAAFRRILIRTKNLIPQK